jgi:TetR/AcrR family transcriptional regulator, tetracycline repressor protein
MRKEHPPLSRQLILETALTLLDEQGPDGLSMRKLAAALNVEAMSLYNHVHNKRDLQNGLTDLVLSQIQLPDPGLPWDERLEKFARELYAALIQHPSLVSIIASEQGRPSDLYVMHGIDELIATLAESGLSPRRQVNAFRGLLAMSFGFILSHTRGFSGSKEEAQAEWSTWDSASFAQGALPHLAQLAPYFLQTSADDDFLFLLRAYIQALKTAD